jgi:hypothetical protein
MSTLDFHAQSYASARELMTLGVAVDPAAPIELCDGAGREWLDRAVEAATKAATEWREGEMSSCGQTSRNPRVG